MTEKDVKLTCAVMRLTEKGMVDILNFGEERFTDDLVESLKEDLSENPEFEMSQRIEDQLRMTIRVCIQYNFNKFKHEEG